MSAMAYRDMADEELIVEQRNHALNSVAYNDIQAELGRRVIMGQLAAAKAQKASARYQWLTLLALYLTVLATIVAPLVAGK